MWHSQAQISNTDVTSTRHCCSLLDSCWNLNTLLAIYVKVEHDSLKWHLTLKIQWLLPILNLYARRKYLTLVITLRLKKKHIKKSLYEGAVGPFTSSPSQQELWHPTPQHQWKLWGMSECMGKDILRLRGAERWGRQTKQRKEGKREARGICNVYN